MATTLLVISSCTDRKARRTPSLTLEDFTDPERLVRREQDLAPARLPAEEMYTGPGHVNLMRGIKKLRRTFGDDYVDLRIVSAGYGVIKSGRPICPYNVTFKTMGKTQRRTWARHLNVPNDVRAALQGTDLAIILLGSDYLDAIDPPIKTLDGQRLVYLAKPDESYRLSGAGVVTVPAGQAQTKYGAGYVALKGKMFELFADTLAARPDLLHDIKADPSPASFLRAIDR